ncbi:response regulator transcription factor [Luteolibacter sp. SL250]|uniref:response regulator transcription factor n=1 Tax=Luteolibacter sp. SL250 TaxID=2995170 RepID=UPI00226DAD51|nr:response regulator transcription factor [Luteolibacter sp. SL250]WAC18038.1 response regulator transcription factor [Luteolibacter sp. SL250]
MSKSAGNLRLVLADDHAVVVMGLEAVLSLEPDMEVVATADDGRTAVETYRRERPDLILLDLRMPDMDGVEAARQIRREFPDARILFLTSYETEDEIQQAMASGATGYALKRSKAVELVQAIRTVAGGGTWIPERLVRRAKEAADSPVLSGRQREVLSLVSKGLSNKEIAEVLGFSESGTKQHLRQIFVKLGVTGRAEAISEAMQRGILKVDE